MRRLILLGAIAAATAFALPAYAGHYVYIHGTRDMLTWHSPDGRALDLTSPDGKGIRVARIEPADRAGLKPGDVIATVDGQPVAHVVDLVTYANAHPQAACKLSVHRGHDDLQLALPAGELTALVHPHP